MEIIYESTTLDRRRHFVSFLLALQAQVPQLSIPGRVLCRIDQLQAVPASLKFRWLMRLARPRYGAMTEQAARAVPAD